MNCLPPWSQWALSLTTYTPVSWQGTVRGWEQELLSMLMIYSSAVGSLSTWNQWFLRWKGNTTSWRLVFNFTHPEYVSVNQTGMIEEIISGTTRAAVKEYVASPLSTEQDTFAEKHRIVSWACPKTSAAPYLFSVSPESPLLHDLAKIIFHSAVAKLTFISNHTRQEIFTTLSFLVGALPH